MNSIPDQEKLMRKVDELNNAAWQTRVSDSIEAKKLSREAINLAEDIDYIKGKAEGYRTLGFSYIRLSQHDKALTYLRKSQALFEEVNDLRGLSSVYEYYGIIERSIGNPSASLEYLYKGLDLTKQVDYKEGESLALYHLGVTFKYLGNYEQALEHLLQSLSIAQSINEWVSESYSINLIGQIYFETGDYAKALEYYNQSLTIRRKTGDKWGEAGCLDNIGFTHLKMNLYDDAQKFCTESLSICQSINDKKGHGNALLHLGLIHQQQKRFEEAIRCGNASLNIRREIGDKKGEAEILLFIAELHLKHGLQNADYEKSFALLNRAMQLGNETQATELIAHIHFAFYEACKKAGKFEEALTHMEAYNSFTKQVHTEAVNKKIQNLEIAHKVEKSRQEAEIYRLRNIELADLYEESNRQKDEIEVQKKNAEEAFIELKAAQSQLIQSEKMASLGELTAGIAHEIQNPLNFVNNFSDLNAELIVELHTGIDKGNLEEVKSIADEIKRNEEKINHHGKRADSIVKGMLQHSHASPGKREPTDINALANEYLRLSYHGLRAKDKNFNANYKTDFDESLGKVEVVPQDLGRVLLNLYNNAFYAVNAKAKQQGEGYQPEVSITTTKQDGNILIIVRDNGNGIPQNIRDKIFQPFFTTKPTGEGTGLGLSMSYDIIKAHGGELKVETQQEESTMFTIYLPQNHPVRK